MSDTATPAPGDAGGATQDVPTDTVDNVQPGSSSDTDQAAEIEKWKALARKHEDRAKANADAAKRLADLEAANLSEKDKAVREAVDSALADARKGFGSRLVDAELRAAAAGRDLDVDALLDGLDRARFLDEDGEPDTAAIKKWLDKIAPVKGTRSPDLGQGRRGTPSPKSKADELLDFFDTNF